MYCFSILVIVGLLSQFYSEGHFLMQPHQSKWHVARAAFSPGPSVSPWLYVVESPQQKRAQGQKQRGEGEDGGWDEGRRTKCELRMKRKFKVTRSRRGGHKHRAGESGRERTAGEERGRIQSFSNMTPVAS